MGSENGLDDVSGRCWSCRCAACLAFWREKCRRTKDPAVMSAALLEPHPSMPRGDFWARVKSMIAAQQYSAYECGRREGIAACVRECEVVLDEDPKYLAQLTYTRGRIESLATKGNS